MAADQIVQILKYILIIIVILVFALAVVGLIMWAKNKEKNNKKVEKQEGQEKNTFQGSSKNGIEKQSIFNFMEFDEVDDNMIIQKNGTRFLMVIECQGVNYDLMSGVEKTGVEEGFVQFLNTLRNPIQIYVQTRSVNLEESILAYKEKLKKVEEKYNHMKMQYYDMKESGQYTREQLERAFFELTKQSNLYEYGRDVINDTERMSLNKNIMNKKYYIIVAFNSSELASDNYDKAETKSLAFSELYTRAQSLISSISPCGVRGKILRTNELIELLYMAYNRDEAEVFGVNRAIKAGYNEINSTAPDVLDKKMQELDKYIQKQALEKAKNTANEIISEKEKKVAEKEENIDDLIMEMARAILKENEPYIGKDVVEESIEKIDSEKAQKATKEKKGGNKDGKKLSKATTRRE